MIRGSVETILKIGVKAGRKYHFNKLPQERNHSLCAILVGHGKIDLVAENDQPPEIEWDLLIK